jgi:hypothetical protein
VKGRKEIAIAGELWKEAASGFLNEGSLMENAWRL